MRSIKYIIIAAISFSISSCGLYTKYQSPEIDTEDLAGASVDLPDSALVALPAWSEYFTDAKLKEYITIALESNSDLQVTRLNIDQAERGLKNAKLAYLPSIAISAEGSAYSVAGSTLKTYNFPLSASWELDLFGRKYNTKHQAISVVAQTREQVRLVETQLITAVATNYYALILADEQLRISNNSLSIIRETLSAQESLKEVGMQSQLSIEQTTASMKSFELTIKDIEKNISLLENSLCLLLNRTPQHLERNNAITYSTPVKESISLQALSNRPDVRYSEMLLSQSFYGVSYARSSLYPSISLSGSIGWTNYASAILDPADWVLSALGSVTQPLFMANVNRANLENAKDRYEQQLIMFEKSLLTAGKEVNDALIEIETSQKKEIISEEQVSRLESAVSISRDLMNSGRVTYLDILSAQNSYLAAQLDYTSIRYANAIAQINLYKALGGGSN
ncbi:MAG: TolC family protein [Rikenellaceae bacterium]